MEEELRGGNEELHLCCLKSEELLDIPTKTDGEDRRGELES